MPEKGGGAFSATLQESQVHGILFPREYRGRATRRVCSGHRKMSGPPARAISAERGGVRVGVGMNPPASRAWVVAAALLGLAVARLRLSPLAISSLTFGVCVTLVEAVRRVQHPRLPWWVAHFATVPWGAIVLLPWGYFRLNGDWIRASSTVGFGLDHTWPFHFASLVALTVGTLLALPRRTAVVRLQPERVQWSRLSRYLTLTLCLYLLSFVIARRGFSALWKLTGEVAYYENTDAATRIAVLDFMPMVAIATLLAATTVRRRTSAVPRLTELFWLGVLAVLATGSGVRARLYLLVIGWLLIQFGPVLRSGASSVGRRTAVRLGGIVVVVVALWIAGEISQLRSRYVVKGQPSPLHIAVTGIDVVGTGEVLFDRGARAGILGGESYRQLPALLVPRRISGQEKPNPASDVLMRELLDESAGFAAPLWLEGALNYGQFGVIAFGVLYGFAGARALTVAEGTRKRSYTAIAYVGPVWLFASYICLSHLTLLHSISVVGAVACGAYLASRVITWTRTGSAEHCGTAMSSGCLRREEVRAA